MVCYTTVVGGSPKVLPHSHVLQEVRWREAQRICGRWWWRFTQHYVSTTIRSHHHQNSMSHQKIGNTKCHLQPTDFLLKGGSTLVLKSEGVVKEHQADVLGVYRMIDSYNERPVYKQDGGENYIYYSSASSSWLVGTVVGHEHAWLRNDSEGAPSTRYQRHT